MNCGEVTPRRRHSGDESRIPVPSSPILKRSGSQRLSNCFTIAENSRNGSTPTYTRSPMLNRHRSLQSLHAPLSSCISPDRDDDLDSLQSYGSNASVTSTMSQCDHASFARNGTTFSSRQKRFVVHCSPQMAPGEEYLTPTQRANRTIRKLKNLLADTQAEVTEKDREIFKLTKEVVELRLLKAGGYCIEKELRGSGDGDTSHCLPQETSPNAGSYGSNEVTSTSEQSASSSSTLTSGAKDVHDHSDIPYNGGGISPTPIPLGDVPPSLVDSGHFEDLNSTKDWSSNSSHNSPSVCLQQPPTNAKAPPQPTSSPLPDLTVEILKRQHEDDIRKLQQEYNDKTNILVQRITEANDRNCELRPKLDEAESRISNLEKENEALKKAQEESEEHHKAIYLQMYKKGQEAAQFESEVLEANKESEQKKPSGEEELLAQLDVTRKELENVKDKDYVSSDNLLSAKEAVSLWNLARKGMYRRLIEQRKPATHQDPEMTLQFLKSAVYYFLTDKENTQGHLQAIESILGFTDTEKINIERASYYWR